MLKYILRRTRNIALYGFGDQARQRKRADKDVARVNRFNSEVWDREQTVARRRYASYEEYLEHQAAKLDEINDRLQERYDEDVVRFRTRFAACEELKDHSAVLCLGARLGAEVEAFIALGHFSVGIDLNPGEENRFVLPGDFNKLIFADGSVDAVYTNVLDHVFQLDLVLNEVHRILKPDGLFIVELIEGFEEGFTPGRYEAFMWRDVDTAAGLLQESGQFRVVARRSAGVFKRQHWTQVVLKKASPTN